MNTKKKFINLIITFLILFNFNMSISLAIPKKIKKNNVSVKSTKKKYSKTKKHTNIESQIVENNNIANETKDNDLLMNAFGFLGIQYRYGSSSPMYGLDCSGFIQYLFKESLNMDLPRTVSGMYHVGTSVKKEDLKSGDLIFFNTIGKRVSHIGMYIGNNQFIHSPRTGKQVEIQSLKNDYWSKRYIIAKRINKINSNTTNKINYGNNKIDYGIKINE